MLAAVAGSGDASEAATDYHDVVIAAFTFADPVVFLCLHAVNPGGTRDHCRTGSADDPGIA
ncbi:hypothetical protein D3C84_1245190 [compost metagenome]